jgi:hypothetical protein
VLEQYGWSVRSAWNSDKTTAFPQPESSADGRSQDIKDQQSAAEFKGECANFLLSKGPSESVSLSSCLVSLAVVSAGDFMSKLSVGAGGAGGIGGLHVDTPGESDRGALQCTPGIAGTRFRQLNSRLQGALSLTKPAGRPARLGPQGRRIAAESGAVGRTGSSGTVGLLCPTACRYGPNSRFHVSPTKLSLK